jgi:hypothetical protein
VCLDCRRAHHYHGPLEVTSQIDRSEVERLSHDLGLTKPIVFERMPVTGEPGYEYGTKGDQNPDGPVHTIRIHPYYVWKRPAEGNKILLHEIRHAYQTERTGPDAKLVYNLLNGLVGYDDNPFEVDAFRFADEHEHDFSLILPEPARLRVPQLLAA